MQVDFDEITIPDFPGAVFQGSADFEWDAGNGLCAEVITFHDGDDDHPAKVWTRKSAEQQGPLGVHLYRQFEDAIEAAYQDTLSDIVPPLESEHRLTNHELM